MAKKSILIKHKKTLLPIDESEEKIFHYLLSNMAKKPATQDKIAKHLGISRSTVRRKLNKLIGNVYEYGYYNYKIAYLDRGYKILREQKNPPPSQLQEVYQQRAEINESLTEANMQEAAHSRILTASNAVVVTRTVVFYETKTRAKYKVATILKSLYLNDFAHDIVPCDKGVYIILKETPQLEEIRTKICNMYTEILKKADIDRKTVRPPQKRKKRSDQPEGS